MTQNDFTPAGETELADEIATAVAEIYTHPASADKQSEQGNNRYGVDMSYFRELFNRELNSSLGNYRPDELARVLARAARTADATVLSEPEFQVDKQAVSVPGRNDLVDTVYLELGKRFNFNVDSPLDMVAYLVDAGFIAEPASANVPDNEYIRALQDACDIIQGDANTEQNYGSLCRIGSVLAKLKATPAMADKQARVPSVLYDGYAVLQEVKRAHAKSGRTDAPTLSAMVSDVLDAAAKLIKKEQGQ